MICICLLGSLLSFAQDGGVIRGRVTAEDGTPIAGATVSIKGKNKGAVTLDDGTFSIKYPGKTTLVITALGYDSRTAEAGSQPSITIAMVKNTRSLDEVVVTALGVKRDKRDLTYSTQEVKGDDLVKSKESNVLNGLTGKLSGVQITNSTGTPGGSASIVIRGTTSILGNNQALIVVDGLPIDNSETGGNPDGGPGTNRLADIDPSTIESVNILKGAAATTLYGAAAARGVVMITTKKGTANAKPTITFSSDEALDYAIYPERQMSYSGGDLGQYIDPAVTPTSTSWGAKMDTLKIDGKPAPFYNPFKMFFKTGVTSNNTVSASGGGSNSGYFMSYSYYDQTGTVPNDGYKRHNLFAKYNSKIIDKLTATFQIGYTYADRTTLPEGYAITSPGFALYSTPVSYDLLPYVNPDGTQRLFRSSRDNPFWIANNVLNTSVVNHFLPLVTLNYTPTEWLNVTERMGADIYTDQQTYHVNVGEAITYPTGYTQNSTTFSRLYNHDFIVQAHHKFGDFNTSLLVGNNIYSKYGQNVYEDGTGLAIPGFYNMSNASTVNSGETHNLYRKVGYYSQLDVDYKSLLVLALTGRYDGSSVLSTQNQYFPYGSAAMGFVFSELLPASVTRVLSFGKLRVSYATVGNDNVQPYANTTPYLQLNSNNNNKPYGYTNGLSFPYNSQNGFAQSETLGNSDLKNELQKEFEVGLEAKLFQDRIGLEVSYFDRKMSQGLIPGAQISSATGYTGTTLNSARMETKGTEVLLNLTPVKTRNFSWDMTVNFTKLSNVVQEVAPNLPMTGVGFVYAMVGQPYGVLYGTAFSKTANGQLRVNAQGLPFTDSSGIVGNITPSWTGGVINTFRYKQLSLSFFFDARVGGQIFNQDDYYGVFYGTAKATENRANPILVHGISTVTGKENTVTVDPETYYKNLETFYQPSIQGATYVKLRNVSLSYALKASTLAHTPFKQVTFTLTGKNLWIYHPHFTGSDPEVSSYGTANGDGGEYAFSTPTSRTAEFTLRLVF
jgi:TonB-linked SusC/RagA family outer membrane protein